MPTIRAHGLPLSMHYKTKSINQSRQSPKCTHLVTHTKASSIEGPIWSLTSFIMQSRTKFQKPFFNKGIGNCERGLLGSGRKLGHLNSTCRLHVFMPAKRT